MSNPNYYAIIPASVRYSDIQPSAKLLYGELTALTSKEGYCWAPNSYFAGLYGVENRVVQYWLRALEKEGFIRTEVDKNGGNKRKIWLTTDKFGEPLVQKNAPAYAKKVIPSILRNTKKDVADATLSFEVVPDEPTKRKPPRDKATWALNQKLYDMFEKEHGVRPTPSVGDYIRVADALKRLKPREIEDMVEEALSQGKKRTVREVLTAREIDIYLQDNA